LVNQEDKIVVIGNKKEQELEELHRVIWAIADELRGAVLGGRTYG
jgi:type I restriction enzyme M protein